MAKIGWGKKYRERVHRNIGNWAIIEKRFRNYSLLFIPEFAMLNRI